MGTHSTIHIYDRNRRNLVNIYTQYDGYYKGVGMEIYEWFSNKDNFGNGFYDTALLFVSAYKGNEAYNKYLCSIDDQEEYNYYIYDTDDGIRFSIKKDKWLDDECKVVMEQTLTYGTLEDFLEELNKEEW